MTDISGTALGNESARAALESIEAAEEAERSARLVLKAIQKNCEHNLSFIRHSFGLSNSSVFFIKESCCSECGLRVEHSSPVMHCSVCDGEMRTATDGEILNRRSEFLASAGVAEDDGCTLHTSTHFLKVCKECGTVHMYRCPYD